MFHILSLQADAENKEILQNEYNEMGNILSKVDMPSYEVFLNIYSKILVNSFSLRSDRYLQGVLKTYLRICYYLASNSQFLSRKCTSFILKIKEKEFISKS